MDYDSTLRRARPLHPINIRGHRRLRHHPIGQNQSTIFALPFFLLSFTPILFLCFSCLYSFEDALMIGVASPQPYLFPLYYGEVCFVLCHLALTVLN